MFIFLMLISFYLFIYLFIYLSIIYYYYYYFILYILLTVGVIPFKVLPTLINVDVNVDEYCCFVALPYP